MNKHTNNTDELELPVDAFGSDTETVEETGLAKEDLEESAPLTKKDVMDIVKMVMGEMQGNRPNYPVHNPVGTPKKSVHASNGRKPIGQYNILEYDEKDNNLVYRWVNDVDDGQRVKRFIDAGYAVVNRPNSDVMKTKGSKDEYQESQMGSAIVRSVGGGKKAVLMATRRDWFEEDQRSKQARIDKIESKITTPYNPSNEKMPDPNTGEYGSARIMRE